MTASTESIQAYRNIKDLHQREEKVKRFLALNPGSTYIDVAVGCRMSKTNASSRLSDLVRAGEIRIIDEKLNPITNRKLSSYALREKGGLA